MDSNCVTFHQYLSISLGEVVVMDREMDRVIPIYPPPNFVCRGKTKSEAVKIYHASLTNRNTALPLKP